MDTDKYKYLMTYSFPCQDLSLAGKGKGMEKGSGTRSGLLWEVERLLNETEELPQMLLMENVTQVHGKKNLTDFENWIHFLETKGYHNYWQDLNAKNYGIPQNRNRCFMVSILSDVPYKFPEPFELKLRLKDMLEDEVEDKFYLKGLKDYFWDLMMRILTERKRLIQILSFTKQSGNSIVVNVLEEIFKPLLQIEFEKKKYMNVTKTADQLEGQLSFF